MKRLIKKSKNNVLVVVDIQKEFAHTFDEEYLNKVENIINENWDKIIVVVDINMGSVEIPEFLYNKADTILEKNYGGFDQDFIEEMIEDGEIKVIEEDELYKYVDDERLIVPGLTHENFLVPEDMVTIFKELQDVTIIGGADQECLDDIENALEYLDVNVKRRNDGIFYYKQDVDYSYIDSIKWKKV